jgi:hypothetical protein
VESSAAPIFEGRMSVVVDGGRTVLTGFALSHQRVAVSPGVADVTVGVGGALLGLSRVVTIRPATVHVARRWRWGRAVVKFDGARVQLLPYNRQLPRLVLALEVAGFQVIDTASVRQRPSD